MGWPNCGIGSISRYRYWFWLVLIGILLALPALVQDVRAKTPGQKHCYKNVCHRVKTISETKALVGKSISLTASHYDSPLKDRYNRGSFTSSGTRFDADDPTSAASANFPDGTELLVWNPKNGRAAHVRVTDFGPFYTNRKLDLTRAAAETLGFAHAGVVKLRVTVVAPPPPDEPRYKVNRKYRRVGGFVGVYRREELKSLANLLILQAERRRQRRKPVLVASRGAHQSRQEGRQTNSVAITPVRYQVEDSRAKIVSLRYVSLKNGAAVLPPPEVSKSDLADPAVSHRVALTREAKVEAAVTRAPAHEMAAGKDLAVGKPAHEEPAPENNEKKIAALSSPGMKTNNGVSDVADTRSHLPGDTSFKRDGVRVAGRFDGSSGFDGLERKISSTFFMDRENQSLFFLVAMLILTSTAIFAAYYSVSNTTEAVGHINPLPRSGEPDQQNPYAFVKIMKTSEQSPDNPALNGKSDKTSVDGADTMNGLSGRKAPLVVTVIKRGSKIAGNLTTDDGVLVEGLIEGDCICCDLTIALGGIVKGRVEAKRAVIKGRVDGRVDVADLHVKNEALIKGEVRYKDLVLDHGATLEARCKRVSSM